MTAGDGVGAVEVRWRGKDFLRERRHISMPIKKGMAVALPGDVQTGGTSRRPKEAAWACQGRET